MKAFFIGSSIYILYLMKVQFKATWDPKLDTLRYEYLLIPCAILSLIINQSFTFVEILWAFSIYLEAVAILPQLFQLTRTGEAENITIHYLGALGMYRALYIPNWIYRYYAEDHLDWIAVVSGVVQTALYSDFLYIYVTRVLKGKSFRLPA
ncbi:endoplasmic reticulum retention protein [Lobulomyces angularis]|nr:endoplasmic reticulum retention protein [Lobulomyces angularis]